MIDVMRNTASIVVLGRLNPAIFQPAWLRRFKIIGETEAEAAAGAVAPNADEVEVIHKELAILNLRDMKLVVDQNRFSLTVLEPPFERGLDFAGAVFSLLSHTPVTALGINREIVFKYPDLKTWHALGDALAPKQQWEILLGDIHSDNRIGGMRSLTMERGKRSDGLPGYMRIEIAPLNVERETKIASNDHYDLLSKGQPVPASTMARRLSEKWDTSMSEARNIFVSIMKLPNPEATINGI